MSDIERTVVTHFLCETEEELKTIEDIHKVYDNVEIDIGWTYRNVDYYACLKTFSTDFDEELI
jgi:hypothetical protein